MTGDREDPTTNEMRHDWLADRWVIIAPQRTERPDDFIGRPPVVQDASACPFCFGRESETPSAVLTYESKTNGKPARWNVRVFPNKFPAVNSPRYAEDLSFASMDAEQSEDGRIDLFRKRELFGGHEVVVESPDHLQSISQLDREQVNLVFKAYRNRVHFWLNDRAAKYVVVFKNVGHDAGASLSHSHSQIIATDITPTDVKRSADRMRAYYHQEGKCLYCSMVEDELDQRIRIVEETPDFLAFCPFASRLPSQICITPKLHQSRFDQLSDESTEQLSWLAHRSIRRLENRYPDTPYNFVIHTAPSCSLGSPEFHWRMELFPRLTKVAGFEWGSECYINPVAPEDAAQQLRRVGV